MNTLSVEVPASVQEDLELISKALSGRAEGLALFGSCVGDGFSKAGDVDIAVFVDEAETAPVWTALGSLDLSLPVRISESYMGGGGVSARGYDIVVLPQGPYREYFEDRHDRALLRLLRDGEQCPEGSMPAGGRVACPGGVLSNEGLLLTR